MNLYTYVKNNPLKYVDPTGHRPAYGAYDENDPNLTYEGVFLDQNGYYTGDAQPGFVIKTVEVLFIDDFKTVLDPDSSLFDKTLAGAGFTPFGKIVKGGKVIVKLASKGRVIERATELSADALKVAASLSKKQTKHILNGHMPNEFSRQVPYLNKETLQNYLEDNTFFNPNWTKDQIISGVEEAYANALKNGSKGIYDYSYMGENIRLFIDDSGNLSTAFGLNKLDPAYFGK